MLIETPFGLVENKDIEVRPMDNTDLGLKVVGYYATVQLDQGLLEGDFSKFETRPYITDVKRLVNLKDNYFKACGYPMGGKFYCGLLEYKRFLFL